jgi:hypothetical protein
MSVTPETVLCVLRSWIAIEVLTPQITKDGGWSNVAADRGGREHNRKTDAQDGPTLWQQPQDDDPPPWPLLPDPPPRSDGATITAHKAEPNQAPGPSGAPARKDRPWYSVILAAMPAKEAFARLDAVFRDETDEDQRDRKLAGNVIATSVVLDEWGGLGQIMEIAGKGDQEFAVNAIFDRVTFAPKGCDGGLAGANGGVELKSGTALRPKGFQVIPDADRLVLHMPGGGHGRSHQARSRNGGT